MEATECGAASLSMIFAFFGRHVALEQMRIETGVSRDGCSAGNIMRAAQRFGLNCRGFRKEPEALRTINTPSIIHWNFNHFVVFEGIRGKSAYINDPAFGRRRIALDELDECYTGIILTFEKTSSFVTGKKPKSPAQLINSRLSGQYGVLLKLVYVGLLLIVPGALLPILTQVFIDDVLIRGSTAWFAQIIFLLVMAITLRAGLQYYRIRVLHRFQSKLMLLSVRSFLSRLFHLPIGFFDQRYAGDLVSRVGSSNKVNSFLAGDLTTTLLNIVTVAAYLALMFMYNIWLTLVSVVSIIISLIVMRLMSASMSELTVKQQQDSGKYAGALIAGLSIAPAIKASGAENDYISRVIGFNAKAFLLEQRLGRLQMIAAAISGQLERITTVLILLAGALFVIQGSLTIGMLAAFTILFAMFIKPANDIAGFIRSIGRLKANMYRIEDIQNYEVDSKYIKRDDIKAWSSKLSGKMELADISFGYSILAEPLIENFGFKLATGKTIALTGPSGSGKTTVSRIISGLYAPWSGDLIFDGTAYGRIPDEVKNASIATVSQNITLFSGSIKDNLTMWNSSILTRDIIAAAEDACIHDTIMHRPGGYEYHLEENGANLSCGQRQRLEIARALTINPSILIMDEATSALDPLVEKQIIDNIKRRGCTCIIVTHRLSAIRDCDEIIVMDHGKISQRGTHDKLLASDGLYSKLFCNI
jgi:NHLM bacteriocin system ABC transporter peptidase/ATP-binding protein